MKKTSAKKKFRKYLSINPDGARFFYSVYYGSKYNWNVYSYYPGRLRMMILYQLCGASVSATAPSLLYFVILFRTGTRGELAGPQPD